MLWTAEQESLDDFLKHLRGHARLLGLPSRRLSLKSSGSKDALSPLHVYVSSLCFWIVSPGTWIWPTEPESMGLGYVCRKPANVLPPGERRPLFKMDSLLLLCGRGQVICIPAHCKHLNIYTFKYICIIYMHLHIMHI